MNDAPRPAAPPTPAAPPHSSAQGVYGAASARQLPYAQTYGANAGLDIGGGLDPMRIARILLRRWLTVLLVAVFAVTVAVFYLTRTTRIYRAEGLFELSVRRPRIMTQQAAVIEDTGGVSTEEIFNTRIEKLRGRAVMQAAARRLDPAVAAAMVADPSNGPESLPPDADTDVPPALVSALRRGVNLSLMRRTRLVRVSFEHSDPGVAAAACNAFIFAAEAGAHEENREASDAAVLWLLEQAENRRQDLLAADNALLEFRRENQLDVLEGQRQAVHRALQDFNATLIDLQSRLLMEQDLLNTLENIATDPEKVGELPAGIARAEEIHEAVRRWRDAIAEQENLSGRFTPEHPDMLALTQRIALLREDAAAALRRAKSRTEANRDLLTKQVQSIERAKQEQAELSSDLDGRIAEVTSRWNALDRARTVADQSYRSILTRIQDARMAADENTATIAIVETAAVPARHIRPREPRILLLALMLGLAGGAALAIGKDYLDDRLTDMELDDVLLRADVSAPTLAAIPHVKKATRNELATAAIGKRFAPLMEAYAGLRAMLESPQYRSHSRVVLIASSAPEEGKTVTSGNLAASWALAGHKTLLIDFDLRRPRMAGVFPMPRNHPGLLKTLSQRPTAAQLAALPYPVDGCPNLHVASSRPVAEVSPAEVIGKPAVAELLQWARENYEYVVIDAPPLGLVSDALALAPLADFTLVMARTGVTRKRLICHTIGRFLDAGVSCLGVVLNDIDISGRRYGAYGLYYHYHQHYKAYDVPKAAT